MENYCCPHTHHESIWGNKGIAPLSSQSRQKMGHSGQLHAPTTYPWGGGPSTHWTGGLVGSTVGLDALDKKNSLLRTGIKPWLFICPACSLVTTPTKPSGGQLMSDVYLSHDKEVFKHCRYLLIFSCMIQVNLCKLESTTQNSLTLYTKSLESAQCSISNNNTFLQINKPRYTGNTATVLVKADYPQTAWIPLNEGAVIAAVKREL
jgi:hypothetical protein